MYRKVMIILLKNWQTRSYLVNKKAENKYFRVDKKRDRLERQILDSQEVDYLLFWVFHF